MLSWDDYDEPETAADATITIKPQADSKTVDITVPVTPTTLQPTPVAAPAADFDRAPAAEVVKAKATATHPFAAN